MAEKCRDRMITKSRTVDVTELNSLLAQVKHAHTLSSPLSFLVSTEDDTLNAALDGLSNISSEDYTTPTKLKLLRRRVYRLRNSLARSQSDADVKTAISITKFTPSAFEVKAPTLGGLESSPKEKIDYLCEFLFLEMFIPMLGYCVDDSAHMAFPDLETVCNFSTEELEKDIEGAEGTDDYTDTLIDIVAAIRVVEVLAKPSNIFKETSSGTLELLESEANDMLVAIQQTIAASSVLAENVKKASDIAQEFEMWTLKIAEARKIVNEVKTCKDSSSAVDTCNSAVLKIREAQRAPNDLGKQGVNDFVQVTMNVIADYVAGPDVAKSVTDAIFEMLKSLQVFAPDRQSVFLAQRAALQKKAG